MRIPRIVEINYAIRTTDGHREWRSVSAVRDADGRVTYFVALFREVNGHGVEARPAKSA